MSQRFFVTFFKSWIIDAKAATEQTYIHTYEQLKKFVSLYLHLPIFFAMNPRIGFFQNEVNGAMSNVNP